MSCAADPGILACAESTRRAHVDHDLSWRRARTAGTRACRRCDPSHAELVRPLSEAAFRRGGRELTSIDGGTMHLEINGRRALVTAASRGLGRAIACALAAEGA